MWAVVRVPKPASISSGSLSVIKGRLSSTTSSAFVTIRWSPSRFQFTDSSTTFVPENWLKWKALAQSGKLHNYGGSSICPFPYHSLLGLMRSARKEDDPRRDGLFSRG